MDNDLIKALRCIASQGEDGNCKMDWHNLLRKDDEPKCIAVTKFGEMKLCNARIIKINMRLALKMVIAENG